MKAQPQHVACIGDACMHQALVAWLFFLAAAAAEAASSGVSSGLEVPTPFAAADVIVHDADGRLSFHYAIVEVTLIPHPAMSCVLWKGKKNACLSGMKAALRQ